MPISTGTRLGSYELGAQIGAGGMGEVYEARDTKLGRNVAIKVLPEAFAHDTDRLSRFQREAKMLASLNHPNIATIHGLEHSNGTHYLVMELVSGETLADRIKGEGPVPVEESLKIAVQIAEALEAAHEKGIIHRDLKPANVKVTPEGKVKVLDFGLAKAFAGDVADSNPSQSPTLSAVATMQGVLLGTAAYMSPEQTRGKAVDKRTDIWAFGCVVYEMLTGEQAFEGEDITEILAAVVKTEPDWDVLPSTIPAKIRDLLHRCLQKDKTLRMQAAGDIRIEIGEALASPKVSGAMPARLAAKSKLPWALAAALAIIATVALLGWWRSSRPAELKPLVRLDVDLGSDVSLGSSRAGPFGSVEGADVILSPDGTRMVYVSQEKLFTRKLDQPKATELASTERALDPFFSPDGQWVAFFGGGKLKKISVEGGTPVVLCDALYPFGGSWGEDGNIVAALSFPAALSQIPSTGGVPTPVTEGAQGEVMHAWPQILPGGKAVLFTSSAPGDLTNFNQASIEVMSLKDHRRKTLLGGTFGRYMATSDGDGYLMYISNGTLFGVPFDPNTLEVRGTSVPLVEQVAYNPQSGSAQFDFSQTGMLLYRSGETAGGQVTVQWLDSEGKTQPLLAKPDTYLRPSLSPDGTRLAVASSDVWVYDWQRDTMSRLTFGARAIGPIWSPDGRYILFQQAPGGMFWTRSDGSGKVQPLTQSNNGQVPWSITADGKRLAFHEVNQASISIWTVALENDANGLRAGKPELFSQTGFNEEYPSFSPDGRWLAYASNESGTLQVYVRAFPGKEGKWQISNNGGVIPEWAHNGHELFFRSLGNQIMVANYTVRGDSFVADKPRVWSEKRIADVGFLPNYGLAPDGKRVVALMPVETPEVQQARNHVIFLENFVDELRRKVPLGGR
jgi:serine/threonine protein kinase/Tol biopolymer transport system component